MNKTIFVLLDACRYDAATRNLGFLEHMIDYKKGAKYKVKGELPSLSRPMYATLLTGLPVCEHGITYNEEFHLIHDSIFENVKKAGGTTGAAAYSWIKEIFTGTPFELQKDRIRIGKDELIDYGIYYSEDVYPDSHVFADGEFIRTQYHPDFMLIHSMNVDDNGHKHGADSTEYELSVALVGHVLAAVLPTWIEEGINVVICGDHGINAHGIHGGNEAEQRDVPLYVFGKDIKPGRFDDSYISMLNVPAIIYTLLGLNRPKWLVDINDVKGGNTK